MPYAKKRYAQRKPYVKRRGRTSWYNKKYSVKQLASYAARGVRKIYGLVNSEMYKLDTTVSSTAIGVSGSAVALSAVPQGDGDGNRTGNSILAKAINVKGAITWNSASALQVVRVLVFIDTQQVPDSLAWAAAGGDTGILTTYSPWSHLNPKTVGRFKILYNKVMSVNSYNPVRNFEVNRGLQHHIRYNGTASTDYAKGTINMLYVCSDSTNPSYYTMDARLSYHDN